MRYIATAIAAALALAGCSLEESEPDIHPAVQRSVDAMETDRDCAGLQAAFDRHDDADTLEYIDAALDDAGCYG